MVTFQGSTSERASNTVPDSLVSIIFNKLLGRSTETVSLLSDAKSVLDVRGNQTQAEQFFSALYEQGQTAQYVRYAGESHSLAQSPANIRDIVERSVAWFDRFVKTPVLNEAKLPGK